MHSALNILLALTAASIVQAASPACAQFIEPPKFRVLVPPPYPGRLPQYEKRGASHFSANPVQLLSPNEIDVAHQNRTVKYRSRDGARRFSQSIPLNIDRSYPPEQIPRRWPQTRINDLYEHQPNAGFARVLGEYPHRPATAGTGPSLPGSGVPTPGNLVPPGPAEPPGTAGHGDLPENIDEDEPLPPLEEELWLHGGSYLYEPEGDRLNWPDEQSDARYDLLRLPEQWQKPRPLTAFQEFLGPDPIDPRPGLKWFGEDGFQWEPRFVAYGSYEIFGIAVDDGGQRTDGIGHQALVELDLRLTGTERFHMQFRPLGEKNSGGSFFQFNNPSGYQSNATGVPDRWWFEGELFSMFSGLFDDEFTPRDYHIVVGKFPFVLHNNLLMNDDIIGVAINKNTLMPGPVSNLNVQVFYGFDDVDGFEGANLDVAGVHLTADYRLALLEATFASAHNSGSDDLDAYYAAFSATQFFGPLTIAGRLLSKWEDAGRRGDGQLYVLESNLHRILPHPVECATGIEHAVFYCNAFIATSGWNSISGGNFDRLRSTFEVNPLVQISRGMRIDDTAGVSLGVQLFRHHEDESIIPEIVWEESGGEAIFGGGVRYQRKIGPRTYIQLQGIRTWSDDVTLQRKGVFFSTFFIL
jgi:hypothetical protein